MQEINRVNIVNHINKKHTNYNSICKLCMYYNLLSSKCLKNTYLYNEVDRKEVCPTYKYFSYTEGFK